MIFRLPSTMPLKLPKLKKELASAGWASFLDAVISQGFSIERTWPMRTEMTAGLKSKEKLPCHINFGRVSASCETAGSTTKTEFLRELRKEIPYLR